MNEKLRPESLTGPQKAAIFLLVMGKEFSSQIIKDLDEQSLKRVSKYMSEINFIPSDVLQSVMDEFLADFQNDVNLAISGRQFLEEVVAKSLDEETARDVFKLIGTKATNVPLSDLVYVPAESLVNIIKGEHPQTIAVVLSYLPQEKAAEILSLLPEELKSDVGIRIVKIGHIHDDVLRELDDSIKRDLSKVGIAAKKIDGVEILANILNEVDRETEDAVLSYVEKEDEELAEQIRQKMFVFEDLLEVDDRGFREILKNIDNPLLVKALKTASDEMKQKMFANLSERAAEMLKEDMDVAGPVKLKEVEEAQQGILKTAKRLETEGKIVLGGKGREEVFV
ncbi:MAG: flagellar motor switch protein FliG [Thermodesulfobacteriota bacterium]